MMDTLLLATDTWDLCLDANGNIAVASAPYALAQDVASACRTFLGEVWYDMTLGIPYDTQILSQNPPPSTLTELLEKTALTVPGVVKAKMLIQSYDPKTRLVTGQLQFVDTNGNIGHITI